MTHSTYKKKKALSLLEVIVVLAIISMTMISSMTVVLRANNLIKNNEVQDTANEILMQAFELLRSPEVVKVQQGYSRLGQAGVLTSYSMEFDDTRKGYLNMVSSNFDANCSTGNSYNVESLSTSNRPYAICLRINITPVAGPSGITRYNVVLTLFYATSSGAIQDDYLLTRYDGFVEIT